MHICPQEIMAVVGAIDILRPTLWMVKHWCESCFNGTHKSCEDHQADTAVEVSDAI
ncbi:hypothetical protein Xoosp13_261 [Xanthomonas phage Xoo-sp13]|nr:hypothetical protein Xoosp13_261 [Xanthomonas phage Xoo-sp13]